MWFIPGNHLIIWVKCIFVRLIEGIVPLGERLFSSVDIHPTCYSWGLTLPERLLNLCFLASLVRWGGGGRERQRRIWRLSRWRAARWGPESAAPPPVPPPVPSPVPSALPALPRGTDLWPPLPGLSPTQRNAGKLAPGAPLQRSSPLCPASASASASTSSSSTSGRKSNLAFGFPMLPKRTRRPSQSSHSSHTSTSTTTWAVPIIGDAGWTGHSSSVWKNERRRVETAGMCKHWTLKPGGPGFESYLICELLRLTWPSTEWR